MDRGKRPSTVLGSKNSKIYMDLKDIIREHALRFLPAKSLLKFQAVCRDWKMMISTPFFVHNQSLSFNAISGLFFQNHGEPPKFMSLDPNAYGIPDPLLNFLPVPVNITASSNGLLCCQSRNGDNAYYICNPATKQFKELRKPNMDHGQECSVVLIFKPSLLNFVAEYKIICGFPSTDFDDATEFEIYSSKDESWKVSGEISFATKKLIPKSGVSVKDVVYWQTHDGSILAFDLTVERSQLIHGGYSINGTLGEMNGKLCAGLVTKNALNLSVISNIHSNTMAMNSRAKMWDKLRFPLASEALGGFSFDNLPVLYIGSNAVLLLVEEKVYSYYFKTKETKMVSIAPPDCHIKGIPYVNSLVSP